MSLLTPGTRVQFTGPSTSNILNLKQGDIGVVVSSYEVYPHFRFRFEDTNHTNHHDNPNASWMGHAEHWAILPPTQVSITINSAEELKQLILDAERWRAITSCARIRMMGSAGFGYPAGKHGGFPARPADPTGHRHLGMEFWSHHPDATPNEKGKEILTTYADHLIELGKS